MSMCDLCSDELGFFDECDSRDCHKRKGGINKMSRWISVKDRLPELFNPVIACNSDGITRDERDPEIAILQEDNKFYYIAPWDYNLYSEAKVTHWMPLPEPPK